MSRAIRSLFGFTEARALGAQREGLKGRRFLLRSAL
jgi:hypothetical protein